MVSLQMTTGQDSDGYYAHWERRENQGKLVDVPRQQTWLLCGAWCLACADCWSCLAVSCCWTLQALAMAEVLDLDPWKCT